MITQKIVMQLPLSAGMLGAAIRHCELNQSKLRELLRSGPIQFVIANVGDPLQWVPLQSCFAFWKNEVKNRLTGNRFSLEQYSDSYCYHAVLWRDDEECTVPLVVLEMHH